MTEREVMAELVRFVGVMTYGKERWFKQNGCWYDRMFGDCIQNEVFLERITEAIKALPSADTDRPTRLTNAEWKDFLSESFGISKSSAREMLHGMMSVKREDNFKKRFNQRRGERREP